MGQSWEVVVLTLDDQIRDRAELDRLAEDHASHAVVTDISSGGAAIEQPLPKPAGLYTGATLYLGIKPTPSLPRRWLQGEIANMRLDGARAVVLGIHWTNNQANTETIEILDRFIDDRLHS